MKIPWSDGTRLLKGVTDDFQPPNYADRPDGDSPAPAVEALENAYHWISKDRTDAYTEAVRAFLK
ncbi:hypothetical protein [Halostella pelagica]|uniref:hypothetical protein n=1 Tax=Halostella pelagica TaxID=2583824 RepID=UPI0010806CFF|nr:hypothetical protein [Halostella pelagica]